MKYITDAAYEDLIGFLLSRESDIALEIEDFGSLRYLFNEIFRRPPNEQGSD